MMADLIIPIAIYTDMLTHLTSTLPNEGCGLLAGKRAVAKSVYPIRNVASTPQVRYQMDGQQQLRAMLSIEADRDSLIAIFHSHPTGPEVPSATDLREASYPSAVYLICVPLPDETWRVRGFKLKKNRFEEVVVSVADQV